MRLATRVFATWPAPHQGALDRSGEGICLVPMRYKLPRASQPERLGPTPGYWYPATRALVLLRLSLRALFGAGLTDGPVDDGLEFVWVGIGVPRFDFLHGTIEDAPADGILDKFREVAFFHALGAKIGAQSKVDFLGDLDIPANSVFHKPPIHTSR